MFAIPLLMLALDPEILQIHIVEGEGLSYTLGSRATRGITVQVADETGKPVEGAVVTFRLPEDGPGGEFASAGKSEVTPTGSDGRAAVWGMRWNRTAGSFEVKITAVKGSARAGAVCPLYLIEGTPEPARARHGISKWVWITAVAGAAGAGAAVAARGPGTTSNAPAPAVNAPSVGTPSISIGRP